MGWSNQAVTLIVLTEAQTGFSGLFGYSPAPGPGNLVLSETASSGTDPYGNAYLAGVTSYTEIGGTNVAAQLSAASVQFYTAASAAGPWNFGPFVALGSNPAADLAIHAPGAVTLSSASIMWTDPASTSWAINIATAMTTSPQDIGATSPVAIASLAATLQPGTYSVKLKLFGQSSSVTGVTYTPAFSFTGTLAAAGVTLSAVNWLAQGSNNPPVQTNNFAVASLTGFGASPPSVGASTAAWTEITGSLTVTATGVLQAEASSSSLGDNYHLLPGSLLEVVPIV